MGNSLVHDSWVCLPGAAGWRCFCEALLIPLTLSSKNCSPRLPKQTGSQRWMISVSLTVSPSNLHPTIITEARNPGSPLISWRGSPQQLLRDHISIHVSTGVYGWNALKTHSRKTCSLEPDISRAHCLRAEKDKKISVLTPCRVKNQDSGRWQQEAVSISVFYRMQHFQLFVTHSISNWGTPSGQ